MPNDLEDPMPSDLPIACSLRATKVLAYLIESSALGEGAPWPPGAKLVLDSLAAAFCGQAEAA
jgi:hypothetical protein